MSTTIAMLFLVEATTACGQTLPARLGGGAEVVRAVLEFEEEAADAPVVTPTGLRRSTDAVPADAELETNDAHTRSAHSAVQASTGDDRLKGVEREIA